MRIAGFVKGISIAAAVAAASSFAFAQNQVQPLTAMPYEPSLNVASLDKSVDPCVDFYKFSCGGWIKNNPIPPDQSSWDLYSKMEDENKERLRGILETASAPDPGAFARAQLPWP